MSDRDAIEAVARALHDHHCHPNCDESATTYSPYYDLAQAAVDALTAHGWRPADKTSPGPLAPSSRAQEPS